MNLKQQSQNPNDAQSNSRSQPQNQPQGDRPVEPASDPSFGTPPTPPAAGLELGVDAELDSLSLDGLPPIRHWTQWAGLVVAASVGVAVALAAFTPYRVTVRAEATVRPTGELKQLEAATAGTVVEILATDNQRVQSQAVIARLDDVHLQTRQQQLATNIEQAQRQLQQLEAQLRTHDQRLQAEDDRAFRLLNSARAELRQAQRDHQDQQRTAIAAVDEVEAQLRSEQASLAVARLRVQRYESLVAEGAISQEQFDEARLGVEQREQAIAATEARLQQIQTGLNPSDAAVSVAREQIAEEQASRVATRAALKQEREALLQQSIQIQQQQLQDQHDLQQVEHDLQQTVIRSPVTGTLFQSNLRNPGQAVVAGETLALIVPDTTNLTLKALVPTTEIQAVAIGQLAQVRINACPYTDYGTLSGIVQTIAPDRSTAQSVDLTTRSVASNVQQPTAYFEVNIQPDHLTFGRGQQQCVLRPGMMGRADILTHEETVLTFLLRKAKLIADF